MHDAVGVEVVAVLAELTVGQAVLVGDGPRLQRGLEEVAALGGKGERRRGPVMPAYDDEDGGVGIYGVLRVQCATSSARRIFVVIGEASHHASRSTLIMLVRHGAIGTI